MELFRYNNLLPPTSEMNLSNIYSPCRAEQLRDREGDAAFPFLASINRGSMGSDPYTILRANCVNQCHAA